MRAETVFFWAIPAAVTGLPSPPRFGSRASVISEAHERMATISVSIEADLCGPVSVGTVGVIKALISHLGIGLTDAEALIDRCVFNGERVEIAAPSREAAEALLAAWRLTPAAPRISAAISEALVTP